MKRRFYTLLVAAALIATLAAPAMAADLVTFTGNAFNDFNPLFVAGKAQNFPDTVDGGGLGGGSCTDQPLGPNSYFPNRPLGPLDPSGFNIENVFTVYDCATDTLYIGLKICGERIAWDADFNDNIVTWPIATMDPSFSDNGPEDYALNFDPDPTPGFVKHFGVEIASVDGGINVNVGLNGPDPTAGLTATAFIKNNGNFALRSANQPTGVPANDNEKDIEVKIVGIRAKYGLSGGSPTIELQTRSGATGDIADEDLTDQQIPLTCTPCIQIRKQVACSADGPWEDLVATEVPCTFTDAGDLVGATANGLSNGDKIRIDTVVTTTGIDTLTLYYVVTAAPNTFQVSLTHGGPAINLVGNGSGTYHRIPHVNILPGGPVFFRRTITNCGDEDLTGVTISDVGCTGGATTCGTVNVGSLLVGETKSFVCSYASITAGCTNTATATGTGKFTLTPVSDVDTADVNVLAPSISCITLVDDDSNLAFAFEPGYDPNDPTPAATTLNLPCAGDNVVQVYYRLFVRNDGAAPVNFGTGPGPCSNFVSSLLGSSFPGITGLPVDVCGLLRAQIPGGILAPGGTASIIVGPLSFDKCALNKAHTPTIINNFTASGVAGGAGICGTKQVTTTTCTTTVNVCAQPAITITKQVSCAPDTGFGATVNALRGAFVYFKIAVTNTGCDDLKDVVITDKLTGPDGVLPPTALLACTSCVDMATSTPVSCIPGTITVGNLAIGATKNYLCKVQTAPAFAVIGTPIDAINTASVVGTGVTSGVVVSAPVFQPPAPDPTQVTVNVLVPKIECTKFVSSTTDFAGQLQDLELGSPGCVPGVKPVFYQLCVRNTGDVAVDFTKGDCAAHFADTLLSQLPTGITILSTTPATSPISLPQAFLSQMTNGVLAAGSNACVVVSTTFNEPVLCPQRNWPNIFSACGFATATEICLPDAGGEKVTTADCTATVHICCPPSIKITKQVSCSPDTGFGTNVNALRGAFVYFKIEVENTGLDALTGVAITDTLTLDSPGSLLPCTSCIDVATSAPVACIGGTINVGNLAIGEKKDYLCKIQTNPAFALMGFAIDATNVASVTGTSVTPPTSVVNYTSLPVTVNVLVPKIECTKYVSSSTDFTGKLSLLDLGFPTCVPGVKPVFYQLCVKNTGEVAVDFTKGDCAAHFADSLLDALPGGMTIVSTTPATSPVSLAQAFLNQMPGSVLAAGSSACVVVATTFDELTLSLTKLDWPNTFSACGFATDTGICLPDAGGEKVETDCSALVHICSTVDVNITKQVSCSPDTGFGATVNALRGAFVYFKIEVKNTGSEDLKDVVITDTLTLDSAGSLLPCAACCTDGNTIPGTITVPGILAVGATKTYVCKFQTNPAFAVIGTPVDATNSASVTGTGVTSGKVANSGPEVATVNVLVPGITCEKLVDDDSNMITDPSAPGFDASDPTPPGPGLNAGDPSHPVTDAFFKVCVINNGEVDVDFTGAGGSGCPDFLDPKISTLDGLISGTGADVNAAMLAELQTLNGGPVLRPGQRVCHVFGPVTFDQGLLCPGIAVWANQFSACGTAKQAGICLPDSGGENVNTGICEALVIVCPPSLKQVYCGMTCDDPSNSNGINNGFGGIIGDAITAVPGVFVIDPGNAQWSNWVAAAVANPPVAYTLTSVQLRKMAPRSVDCPDVFKGETKTQTFGNIQLTWPLMYEMPGTTFTLTINYNTAALWNDGSGPKLHHQQTWSWQVKTSLEDLKLLLALFHELPLGSHQVPLISDETLYPVLLAKLDHIIDLVHTNQGGEAGIALDEFVLEVEDACITSFIPTRPIVTGQGTGIANTCENPACCKILADVTWIQNALGLSHP